MAGASAAPYWVNAAAGQAPRSHLPMQGGSGVGGGGAGTPEASPPGARPPPPEVSRELNRLITQASTLHDLMRTVNASFDSLNGVNLCTAYHRIARHTQDSRSSLDRLPPPLLTQLGGLLTRLNIALVPMVTQVQAQNLGITLWSMSKLARAPQSHASDLIDALQQEVARRLQNVTKHMYLKDKHYNFGAQALSNVIYSAAYMNRRLDYELLHLVAKAMGWQIEDFRPQGLANTVWSLGKLGTKLTFEVRKLVDACCAEMCTQLRHQGLKGNFAPQNISNALHGLAKLGYVPPPDLLAAMATCALGQLRLFGAQEMTNMVWGYAQLASNGAELPQEAQALFDRVADDLTLLLQDRQWRTRVRPQTISNLAWAFAKLKRCPQKLNQDLVREALSLLPQFKPQELSNLLWALATMGHYPGSGIIDALVQAICTVCVEMKPQELANTAWALATLRHFPGAKALDPLIHHAASMLDRFKAQEIGNLLWALARLGYMPAAGFALAVMPFIQQWRQTDVQDCGNLLWAFMILDVLTPEAVQLLGERLRALPISQFTQESYIQIYQAKMAMSQKVATIAQHIPPELLRQAELEWRQQSFHNRVSKTHKEVSDTLMQLSEPHEVERRIEDGLLSVDLALNDRMVAVEVDGSSHFSVNEPYVPLGKSVLRWRILASRGWRVVTVPYYRWAVLRTADERKEYLWRLLQCNSVWECLSVDPSDRDAPMVFPPNMAHITRDDVVSYLAPGAVLPSLPTFLHPRPGPSQAASPVSTLMGALTRPGSTHSTPSAPNQLTPLQRVPSSSGGGVREGGASGGRSAHGDASLLPLSAPLTAAGSWGGQEGAEPASPQLPYGFGSPFNNNGGADGGGRPRPPSLPQFPHLAAAADGGGHVQGSAAQPPPPSSSSMGAYGGLHGLPAPLCGGSGAGGAGAGPQQRQPSSAHARGLSVAAKPFSMSCPSSAGPPYGGTGLGGAGSAAPPPSNTSLYFTPPQATPLSAAYSSPPLSLPPGCPPAPAGDSSWGPASLSLPQSLSPDQPPLLSAAAPAAALQGSEFCTPTHSPSTLPLLPIAPPSLPQLGQRHAHGSGTAESMPESMSVPRVSTHPATDLLSSAPQDDEIDDLRSYFAQVTGVSAAPPASSSAVLSLEQAMVRVLALPSDCPIADLAPCFQHWEGERFAQLLTALGGQQARSLQLFDWVRGLPPDAPLSALCCAASYAAMIGLHGEWRQPGRALRLLSDAKARGVELGAEIYAALVQAMCRCGQYDVASDAFQHMLTQQLPIEGAVLRSVLSSYMERGAWGEVLRLLDLMQAHDADVDAQTYTLVISGAAGAGDRGLLMSAYNHMCDAGVAPTPDTFVKLVDLTLQWERSVVVAAEGLLSLAAMAPVGADSPTGSQDSPESCDPTEAGPLLCLLRACHATGQWHLAQQVLARAGQHGFPTCLRAANEVIASAAQCGMPEQAQAMFDGLAADGLTPDAASYRGLVEAYLRGGDWMQGCMKYEEAVAAGHTLPSSACCAVLGALWDSGLAWAQAKAGLLHGELLSAGALDPPLVTSCRGSLRVDLNVVDPGAGVLALRQWMLQLRDSIGNSQTAGLLEKHRKLVIMNGSSGSTPQGLVSDELKGMVGTTLVVHRSPFKLSLESGRASKLEASAQLVTKWLFTESFQGWCRVVGGEGGLAGSPLTLHSLPPISAWREVEEGRRQECFKAFQAIRAREARQEEDLQRCPDAYRSRRAGLISQSRTLVHSVLKLPLEVWHTAAALLDGVGRSGYLPPNDALLAAACVVAAAKQEGQSADSAALAAALDSEAVLQSTGLTPTAALDAEVSHLAALLGGATAPTSARRCWRLYADRLGVDPDNTQQVHSLLGDSSATLDSLLGDDFSLQYPPSLQAAAVVSAARKQAGIPPFWPSVLRELTGYDDRTHQQFADAVACFERPTSYGPMVVAQVFS